MTTQKESISATHRRWVLYLFGTAVGAGILFLPIRAGGGGFWPVVAMSALIFPMVWLSHRGLSRFVLSASDKDMDITHASEEYYGRNASIVISILYFFAIYPICLAYGVGMTNTFASFIINQLQIQSLYDATTMSLYPSVRLILAIVIVGGMMSVMLFSQRLVTIISNVLVYPLCIVLFAFSIYLIPQWNLSAIGFVPTFEEFLVAVWLTLPVLVFAFNHSPAISSFSKSLRQDYGEDASKHSNKILLWTSFTLLIFVMFFVFSCILSLSNQDFELARAQNIPILSYFANKLDNPFISYGAPLIAFLAILTSFFGHYYGASEGLQGIARKALKNSGKTPNLKALNIATTIFMFITITCVAYINPSILGFIEDLGGPIIAIILFILPLVTMYFTPYMKRWRSPINDIFVLVTGILTITSVVYKLL